MEYEVKREGGFEYIEHGEGPILLSLHGLFGALSNFKELFDYFSKKYRVVIPIMPIYTRPVIDTNVKSLGKYVHKFITFKGFDKLHILGNSLGGHVALIYTAKYFEKVQSMILTGSSGLYENTFGGTFPRREDYNFIKEKVAVTFYDAKHATKELVDECFELVNDRGRLVRILAIAKSAIRHNMAKELPHIHVPTCLIWGKNDIITPPEVAEEFHELLPNSELFWIDLCGHAPMMEHPQEFNTVLDEWLSKLPN